MPSNVYENELIEVRRKADALAKESKTRLTTCHFLVALSTGESEGAKMLRERRLSEEVLAKAARVIVDEPSDAPTRILQAARSETIRLGNRARPTLHLLSAISADRSCAAAKALVQCGVDLSRLRSQTAALSSGVISLRTASSAAQSYAALASGSSRLPAPSARPPAVTPNVLVPKAAPPSVTTQKPVVNKAVLTKTVAPAAETEKHTTKRRRATDIADEPPPSSIRKKSKAEAMPSQGHWSLDPKKFPTIARATKNLTELAATKLLEPVSERAEYTELLFDILGRKEMRTPCIVGPAGVGKSALLRGLAYELVAREDDRILLELDISELTPRGQTDPCAALQNELKKVGDRVLLAIENCPDVFAMDAPESFEQLKRAIAKGQIACIATGSQDGYRKVIESDATLRRGFSPVELAEPDRDEALEMVDVAATLLETHHQVKLEKGGLGHLVDWSIRYLSDSAMPNRAVGALDLVLSRVHRSGATRATQQDLARVISEMSDVPEDRLLEADGEKLLRLEAHLAERIVGHTPALTRIAQVLRRSSTRVRANRPLGSFLLLGSTGVGKTETAKAVAECLFGSEDAMTRLDLSEYAESHSIARLVGAPPGYVGFDAGGQLTEAVKRRPYQVILLDEVEKAHRDVLEAFLQVFDEGRMTDGRGKTVDFSHTVIFLTSNLGVEAAASSERSRIGFGGGKVGEGGPSQALLSAAKKALAPEIINRFDDVLAYSSLGKPEIREIASRMMKRLVQDFEAARGLLIDYSDELLDALLATGNIDLSLGARPMRRAIERLVEAPLAELILRGDARSGDVVVLSVENGEVVVDAIRPQAKAG